MIWILKVEKKNLKYKLQAANVNNFFFFFIDSEDPNTVLTRNEKKNK